MEEYPKRLYLDDGTAVTVQDAAEEQRWRGTPPAPDSAHESPLKKAVKKVFGKGATDA